MRGITESPYSEEYFIYQQQINESSIEEENDRSIELIFADWLEERGYNLLAEGWRMLVEYGKKPQHPNPAKGTHNYRWFHWFAHSVNKSANLGFRLGYWYFEYHKSYFKAMESAALQYVRERQENPEADPRKWFTSES